MKETTPTGCGVSEPSPTTFLLQLTVICIFRRLANPFAEHPFVQRHSNSHDFVLFVRVSLRRHLVSIVSIMSIVLLA